MRFHLNYKHPVQAQLISHKDKILLTGSCFAETIGNKLISSKFNCLLNPNGILFNPISIAYALRSYISPSEIEEEGIVSNNGLYSSLHHHGCFSYLTKQELKKTILQSDKNAHFHLKEASFVIITFGTSAVFKLASTGEVVANCHKLPPADFTKEQLQPSVIIAEYNAIINEIKKFNQNVHFIFTVSPVKYLRDGLIENNLSKSVLIYSIHEIIRQNNSCSYFPAYEIVNDDLRDYRFYKPDMAHPNEMATNYVWQQFKESYFAQNTLQLLEKIEDIKIAEAHRPIHLQTEGHKKFTSTYLQKCRELMKAFPELDFTNEINYFSQP